MLSLNMKGPNYSFRFVNERKLLFRRVLLNINLVRVLVIETELVRERNTYHLRVTVGTASDHTMMNIVTACWRTNRSDRLRSCRINQHS